ncbi:MAG: D-glucuronyl C5-epimerase family protein [Solirubrobacteraceae bacterium]
MQRAKRLAALALGVLALGGATTPAALAGEPVEDRPATSLAPVRVHVRARAAAGHGPTVSAVLASLLHGAAIGEAVYHQDYTAYVAAKSSLGKLSGTRKEELGAVLANVQAMARAGELIPSRLPALFLTLERNRQWWTTEPLIAGDERVSLPGSEIVWEHYPGQGIQIQWLATFGKANGYYLSGHENANLRQLLGEVIPLATQRAGGIAWEYMFEFDGGTPPWTSGLSQGTALQVLARAWSRFKEPAYLSAAQQALGVFQTPPPQGVRVSTPAGAMYAEYTYAPSDRILNGFIQSLVGLYDYTSITKDPLGLALFEAGDAEARAIVPLYDTGGWSLYDQFGESDLNYHELLTEFLQHLCERTSKGPPIAPASPPSASTPTTSAPTTPAPSTETSTSGTGGASASSRGARSAQASGPAGVQILGDQIYCTIAQRFTTDLQTPPAISLLSKTLPGGARAGVQLSLSKISTVRLTVRQGSRVVWTNGATLEHGKPRLLWITPAKGGTFSIELTATDLAGNFSTASGTVVVSRH